MTKRTKRLENISVREEPFGYTIFNKTKLRHTLIVEDDLNQVEELQNAGGVQIDRVPLDGNREYKTDILSAPIRVYYETTLGCNLRCKICFNRSGRPRPNELSTQQELDSLDSLKEARVLDIRFTGGEPTQREDWFRVMSYAKKLGFATSCNTNAAFDDPEVAEKMADLNLDQVTVSLDGNEERHDTNRGRGSFAKTIHNLKAMSRSGAQLRINSLVTRVSLPDVPYLIRTAAEFAKEINLFTPVFIGRGKGKEGDTSVTGSEHLEMAMLVDRLSQQYPDLNVFCFSQVTKSTSINTYQHHRLGLKPGFPPGTTTLNLTSDGGIWCGGYVPYIDASMSLGNIKNDNLVDIWQHHPTLEQIRDDGSKLMRLCGDCPEHVNKRCQGAKYETELERLIRPETKNPWCVYGDGPSLIVVAREKY